MSNLYEVGTLYDSTSDSLTLNDYAAKEHSPGSNLFVLNPFIDIDSDCNDTHFKSSIISFEVGEKPIAVIVFGFGQPDIVECSSDNYVGGYIQKDFRCLDSEALELVRCGEGMLSLTEDNPIIITPFPNTKYTFVNHSSKRLYVMKKHLFENNWVIPEMPCCCPPIGCGPIGGPVNPVDGPITPMDNPN